MTIQTNVDLRFPFWLYSFGCEPELNKSINYHSKTDFLKKVKKAVGIEVWDYIRASPLGVIVQFVENEFTWSSKIVEYLLVKQLVCKKKYEIWCLFDSTPAWFSLSEFEWITTLNCAHFPAKEDTVETIAHKYLWKKMKVNEKKNLTKFQLREVCTDVENWSKDDKIQFAYLSILATIIIGKDGKKMLPSSLARMVFDLPKFEKYRWSRVAFKKLIKSVKRADLEANCYTIHGFLQTLQIWAYNVVPCLGRQIGHPSNVENSPLLKFKGANAKSNLNIDAILIANKDKIESFIINELVSTVWDDERNDENINALLEVICKEGGLGLVTWIEKGSKICKKEIKSVRDSDVDESGKTAEDKGDGVAQKESLKRQKEIETKERKRSKVVESKTSSYSVETDTIKALHKPPRNYVPQLFQKIGNMILTGFYKNIIERLSDVARHYFVPISR